MRRILDSDGVVHASALLYMGSYIAVCDRTFYHLDRCPSNKRDRIGTETTQEITCIGCLAEPDKML